MTYEELQKWLLQATKDRNKVRKSVLADVKTTALMIAIEEKHKENVTEENVLTAMKKYQKTCQQQIDTCPASRPDLLEAYQACMDCITYFLPKQLTEEDINDILIGINPKTLPEAMKIFTQGSFKGRADMKLVNKMVKEYLNK